MRRGVVSDILERPLGGHFGVSGAPRTVIAIDGPAASGKSSTAQWVAERLEFRHVDSGSLYRGLTAAMLRTSIRPDAWTGPALVEQGPRVSLRPEKTSFSVLIDGESSESELRGSHVTEHVSLVVHEGMNQADDREARSSGSIGSRRLAAFHLPAQDLVREAQASQGVSARSELHLPERHVEDVGSARGGRAHPPDRGTARKPGSSCSSRRSASRWMGRRGCEAAHVAAPALEREV